MIYDTVTVEEDSDGNLILPISEEIMNVMGWEIGDEVEFEIKGDGTVAMYKTEPKTGGGVYC